MKIRFSERYEDIAAIHDALYSYNLSKTGSERLDVHAERFPEQFALLGCDERGAAHGGIACHWENAPRHIFADYLYLDDRLRGGGFGRRLMEELIAYAESRGASRIDLTTSTFQAPGFYLKLGFRITEEKSDPKPRCPENIHYCLSRNLGRPRMEDFQS